MYHHYSDEIMGAMASQITSLTLFTQPLIHTPIKENIKAPCHWLLCGYSPTTGEVSAQKASNAENVSIWWRNHQVFWAATLRKGRALIDLNRAFNIVLKHTLTVSEYDYFFLRFPHKSNRDTTKFTNINV